MLAGVAIALALGDADTARATPGPEARREVGASQRPPPVPRSLYAWPWATGPHYGSVAPADRWAPGVLVTAVGSFDLSREAPPFPAELTAPDRLASGAPHQHFILQVDPHSVSDGRFGAIREAVVANGGEFRDVLPVSAHLVRLTRAAREAVSDLPGVLALVPYHPAFKLHPSIGRLPLPDPEAAVSEIYDLDVRIFEGEDPRAAAAAIADLGGKVTGVWPDTVRARLHRSLLPRLAAIEAVQMVFEHAHLFGQAEESSSVTQVGTQHGGPSSLHEPYRVVDADGGGQVLMMIDSGISLDAGELSETRTDPGTPGPGHRKVLLYETAVPFGGEGDLLGCDAPSSGGVTHGHLVAATALGYASDYRLAYGGEYTASDGTFGRSLNGVARGAKLVAYDAHVTPAAALCTDPLFDEIVPGDLYSGTSAGPLAVSYDDHGARAAVIAWGGGGNNYDGNATDVDKFLFDKKEAMVLVAAGNGSLLSPATAKNALAIGATGTADTAGTGPETRWTSTGAGPAPGGRIAPQLMAPGVDFGGLGIPSEFACSSGDNDQSGPANCSVVVQGQAGTSFAAAAAAGAALVVRDYFADGFYPDGTTQNPGNDDDKVPTISGALTKATLIASADWVGVGVLPPAGGTLRYRFNNEQGYGRIELDNVLPLTTWSPSPEGLIVADLGMEGGVNDTTLELAPSEPGAPAPTESLYTSTTFDVEDSAFLDEIRVALAWIESAGQASLNDLDLEVCAPADPPCTGTVYWGNYFTDDNDRDAPPALDPGEDCPGLDGTTGALDESPWSLASCANSIRDTENTTEAVFLSVDPNGDGPEGTCSVSTGVSCYANADCPAEETCNDSLSQVVPGEWTVRVIQRSNLGFPRQPFAVAIAGSLHLGSTLRFDRRVYACNGRPALTVREVDDTDDPASGLTAAVVRSRVRFEVVDVGPDGQFGTGDDTEVDTETTGPAFTGPDADLVFRSIDPVLLSEGTAPDPGNGALDVRHGNYIRAYYDEPQFFVLRSDTARIDCDAPIDLGGTTFPQYGTDSSVAVEGGCEVNARGNQEFGFPDRYLDAGERAVLRLAFTSPEDLENATSSLRCVLPDTDSPAGCMPGSTDCDDPNRETNPTCPQVTTLDPEKPIGRVLGGAPVTVAFHVRMADTIAGEPKVEFVLGLESAVSGKTTRGVAIVRQKLDVDEAALFYSTDFPTGGSEAIDWNNDEEVGGTSCVPGVPCRESARGVPITSVDPDLDYRFETWAWSDLTAGTDASGAPVARNTGLSSPWSFDTNDGGFRSGLGAVSHAAAITNRIANWGEDLDFDGVLDGLCDGDTSVGCESQADCDAAAAGTCDFTLLEDRDPVNGMLDQNRSARGGCGWQSRGANPEGGAWHTGRIGDAGVGICEPDGDSPGQCQTYETVGGASGYRTWVEFLLTPVVEKVNRALDGDGEPVWEARILGWSWNAAIDLPDSLAAFSWELDNDLDATAPVHLTGDGTVLGLLRGPFSPRDFEGNFDLTDGYPMFAPLSTGGVVSQNGVVGTNREGKNACGFEGGAVNPLALSNLGLALPPDDDADDDLPPDGAVDETVTPAGPRRNFRLSHADGPDMRLDTLEDLSGPTGNRFQGALGFWVFEKSAGQADPMRGFGAAIDDVVLQWKEVRLDPDLAVCGAQGSCAVLAVSPPTIYEGNTSIEITLQETSHDGDTDCDGDGAGDGVADCSAPPNGRREVRVRATSLAEPSGESLLLEETAAGSGFYRASLPISTTVDLAGTLFVRPDGAAPATVSVTYEDADDGFGGPCRNASGSGSWGMIRASATVHGRTGLVLVKSVGLSDNGDDDGYADTNETVDMAITVLNKTGSHLADVVAWLTTDSPHVECILDPVVRLGDLDAGGEPFTSTDTFTFKVRGDVNRLGEFEDLAATFEVTMSSAGFETLDRPQTFTLDLDLDRSGGGAPSPFEEDFDTPGTTYPHLEATRFSVNNLDDGIYTNVLSDGYRCQYNDPDNPVSNSFGEECHLGANPAHSTAVFWHQHGPGAETDVGYSGSYSAHFGVWDDGPSVRDDTTPLATLEALELTDPVYLTHAGLGAVPELTFKHRVSMLDDRAGIGVSPGQALDRGVVQIQLADAGGAPRGPWITIEPYHNIYDAQAAPNFANCTFDPTDDGSDEDDLYDPSVLVGPSSSCYTRYGFAHLGDTNYRNAFDENAVGRASDGGALEGDTGGGTWVESRFDLERFQGRRVRIRFLATTVEVDAFETVEDVLVWNPTPLDDGWYIDDVRIDALDAAAAIVPDARDNSLLPNPCTQACGAVASLAAAPPALDAPGQSVLLDARGSVVTSCAGGVPQYQFWQDDGNGVAADGADVLLRDWAASPLFAAAPAGTTDYAVAVRCSASAACRDDAAVEVAVGCPSSGSQVQTFGQSIGFDADRRLAWSTPQEADVIEGNLGLLRAAGTLDGSVRACLADDLLTTSIETTAANPSSGNAYYYLARRPRHCNAITWKASYPADPTEHPGGDRDLEINADSRACRP